VAMDNLSGVFTMLADISKSEFVMVLFLAGFGVFAALPVLVIPRLLAPNRANPIKNSSFECGQVPSGEGRMHFMMQYYSYLLMFVIFDVMSIFLFSWAVVYLQIGIQSAFIITLFLVILFVPMGYALHMAGRRDIW